MKYEKSINQKIVSLFSGQFDPHCFECKAMTNSIVIYKPLM